MSHYHIPKIVDWKFDEAYNFIPSLYGCTACDETFVDLPIDEVTAREPTEFYLKARTLQFSTGDANSSAATSSKKWDSENNAFADAVRQGVNPGGVSRSDVDAAMDASETLGYAYDAEAMVAPEHLTPLAVDVMNELKTGW